MGYLQSYLVVALCILGNTAADLLVVENGPTPWPSGHGENPPPIGSLVRVNASGARLLVRIGASTTAGVFSVSRLTPPSLSARSPALVFLSFLRAACCLCVVQCADASTPRCALRHTRLLFTLRPKVQTGFVDPVWVVGSSDGLFGYVGLFHTGEVVRISLSNGSTTTVAKGLSCPEGCVRPCPPPAFVYTENGALRCSSRMNVLLQDSGMP